MLARRQKPLFYVAFLQYTGDHLRTAECTGTLRPKRISAAG